MAIHVRSIRDEEFQKRLLAALTDGGFNPQVDGERIILRGVGVAHGDQSVNLDMRLLEMDGHRVLAIEAPIAAQRATFDYAALACVRGGGACTLAKIDVVEHPTLHSEPQLFGVVARFHLYADHLSPEELRIMLQLFLKEVDEIDNELAAIMAGA